MNAMNEVGQKAKNNKKAIEAYAVKAYSLRKDIEKMAKSIVEARRENTNLQVRLNEVLLTKLSEY